ncbi:MAG: M28 family peptidase [Candidatus Bathyarchaeota archaeon]|nr:M28 family peptidase [Candidatus Bathyarchaeota archaeon]
MSSKRQVCKWIKILLMASIMLISFFNLTQIYRADQILTVTSTPSEMDYLKLASMVDMELVKHHLYMLSKGIYEISGVHSRATGTLGNELAARYIYEEFNRLMENVSIQSFRVPVPKSYGANITFPDGSVIKLYPVLPNLVCPSTTPPEGISGTLQYAREGYLKDFDGMRIEGSIVILDYESGNRWLNAMKLGAKAVIFLPPKDPLNSFSPYGHHHTHPKYLENFPVYFPRFYVKEEDLKSLFINLGKNVTIKSTVRWENAESWNIIGFIRGENPNVIFGISSYYDSYSFAPDLAPGAQDACGIAALLALAKHFNEHRPKATIIFIAFGGHYQTVAGALQWAESREYAEISQKIWMILNLDLSTGSDALHVTNVAHLWTHAQAGHTEAYIGIGRHLENMRKAISEAYVRAGLEPPTVWTTYIQMRTGGPGDPPTNYHEPHPNRAFLTELDAFDPWGSRAPDYCNPAFFNIITAKDIRPYIFTPFDTYDKLNFENLEKQLRYIYALILTLYSNEDVQWLIENPLRSCAPSGRVQRNGAFVGQTAFWDPKTTWYKPVPNLLVVARMYYSVNKASGWDGWGGTGPTYYRFFTYSDENGTFRFPYTVRVSTKAWVGTDDEVYFEAYAIDPETGQIVVGPDLGRRSMIPYPFANTVWEGKYGDCFLGYLTVQNVTSTIIVSDNYAIGEFVSRNLYDRFPHPSITVNTFLSHVQPEHYAVLYDPAVGLAAILLSTNEPIEVMIGRGRVPYGLIVNASRENMLGTGITFGYGQTILKYPYLIYCENLRWVIEERFRLVEQYKPVDPYIYGRFIRGVQSLEKVYIALNNLSYSEAYAYMIDAWSDLYWAYANQRGEIENIVSIAPYVAFFLVPFAYLTERLILKSSGSKRIASTILILVLIFCIIYTVNPTFKLSGNPVLMVIAFSTVILSIPILFIILSKVVAFLNEIRIKVFGRHEIQVGRVELAIAAIQLGIENMRKRKGRTALVLVSIALTISALVAMTWFIQDVPVIPQRFVPPETGYQTIPYNGILIHYNEWGGEREGHWIGELVENYVEIKYSSLAMIAKRAWYWPWYYDDEAGIDITHENNSIKVYCLYGLSPEDHHFTSFLPNFNGRWFLSTDKYACILMSSHAQSLKATINSIIEIQGMPYKVIGIIRDEEISSAGELDGYSVLPVDIRASKTVDAWVTYYEPSEVIFIPYWTVINIWGARTGCISLKISNASLAWTVVQELYERFGSLSFWVCMDGKVYTPTRISQTQVFGLEYMFPAIGISMLSILNMMLASVMERKKEISVYSVLGASPLNTALMFLTEHAVHAVIGGVCGFIGGNVLLLLIARQLGINYTYSIIQFNVSVLGAMLMVILVSVYPATIIAKLVTPSLERAWKMPTKPVGDNWDIPMPFFTSGEEVGGVLEFMREFFSGHYDSNAPVFWVESIKYVEGEADGVPYMGYSMQVHLFPYETGIIQEANVIAKTEDARWRIFLLTKRLTGMRDRWIQQNRGFADAVRKQLLLWRSLKPEEKMEYIKKSGGVTFNKGHSVSD